jgi:tetratricopeptide (TPR) repeat protein
MENLKQGDYYQAAVYYLEENKDLKKAQGWMEKALEMREKPAYWMYRQYALILAKRNDKKAALKAVKTSLALAEKAGNKDYVIMNKASIADME